MAEVVLISNPSATLSVFEWRAVGVQHLSRENKLSSLPFWTPNSLMKKHQFRLVLLKGLAPTSDADAMGLVLEVIPPPSDPEHGAAEKANMYPGGCTVSVVAKRNDADVNASDDDDCTITDSITVLLDQDNSQASFVQLVPGTSPLLAADTVLIRVTIETGVNVLAQQVTNTVASLWSVVSSSVAQLVGKTIQVYHDQRIEVFLPSVAAGGGGSSGTPPAASSHPPPPWEVVPPKWSDRAAEWRVFVSETAVEDDGLFLYGPDRSLSVDSRNAILELGLNYRLLTDSFNGFQPDRDIHEGLLSSPVIRQMRYRLVPAKIKDDLFWANYYWKVSCVGVCDSIQQAKSLLSILNAPPPATATASASARSATHSPNGHRAMEASSSSSPSLTDEMADAREAAELLQEYLAEESAHSEVDALLIQTAADACASHVQRLEAFIGRTDLSEDTLQLVGSTLRVLRERVAKYHQIRSTPSAPAKKMTREQVTVQEEEVPEETEEVIPSSSGPTAPASTEIETPQKESTSIDNAHGTSSPPPCEQQVNNDDDDGAPIAAAAAGGAGGSRATSVSFPKMPWEEDM